jgi:hypothetical protein
MKPDNGKGRWRDDVMMSTQDIHPALTWRVAWRGNVGQISTPQAMESAGMFANFRWFRTVEDRGGEDRKGVANFGLHLPKRAYFTQRTQWARFIAVKVSDQHFA